MRNLKKFYNQYHKFNKNKNYQGIIGRNNFTYFYVLDFIEKNVPLKHIQTNILDVGCGVGSLSIYFSQFAKKVIGIDVSTDAIAIAKRATKLEKINNVSFLCSELKRKLGKFDFVICSEVIEHIDREKELLKTIHSNLTENGILFLSTPSKNNFLTKVGYFNDFDRKVGHLRRYSKEELLELLESNNFKVIKIEEKEGILRMILFTTKLGNLIRVIRGPLIGLFHFFDKLSTRFFGNHDIQVIAQKR